MQILVVNWGVNKPVIQILWSKFSYQFIMHFPRKINRNFLAYNSLNYSIPPSPPCDLNCPFFIFAPFYGLLMIRKRETLKLSSMKRSHLSGQYTKISYFDVFYSYYEWIQSLLEPNIFEQNLPNKVRMIVSKIVLHMA